MGIYVNPGNTAFWKAVNEDVYVDKTELITYTNSRINKMNCFVCVSRPRRFGKSMAVDMLTAYYSKGCDSNKLFAGRKAKEDKSFVQHLNQHHVIRLDIQKFLETEQNLEEFIDEIERAVVEELMEEFPDCKGFEEGSRLKFVLDKLFVQTGQGFVFIIDEWDCVFRVAREHQEVQKNYLNFLRGLFKGSPYVELAYMTGILPIKKYGEHSAINIFKEFSMVNPGQIAECFGFTEAEVKGLCERCQIDYTETQKWYDGYLLGDCHIYNPQAVTELIDNHEFQNYWTGTETYEALKLYIDRNFDGLKEAITIMELPSGKGYADVVYLPKKNIDKPALIVELKWNKSAHGAIQQIKEKQYAAWIEGYVGEILLIGITYHQRSKSHECMIEKYVK